MLTLVGLSHLDLDSYTRLSALLTHLKPSVIGIEDTKQDFEEISNLIKISSNSKIFEKAITYSKKKYPDANPETLKQWLSSTYGDHKAIIEYSNANFVQILHCDNPQVLEKIDFESEANDSKSSLNKTLDNFLRLSPNAARLDIANEYSLSKYPVNDCEELVAFYQARDNFSEQILRSQTKNTVYVCGLAHIFGDYNPNLFDSLKDLQPKRIKLCEADYL
ncbi:MAG: hypothetical protein ACOC1K_03885 [Nanoarchaeota archaeon]